MSMTRLDQNDCKDDARDRWLDVEDGADGLLNVKSDRARLCPDVRADLVKDNRDRMRENGRLSWEGAVVCRGRPYMVRREFPLLECGIMGGCRLRRR